MYNRKSRLILAAAFVLGGSTAASACRTNGVSGVAGQTVDSRMSVEQGKSCMFRHFSTKFDAIGTRRYPTTDIELTSNPSSGAVAIAGNRITYKARPGARGSDSFSYRTRLDGRTYGYRVNVEIY